MVKQESHSRKCMEVDMICYGMICRFVPSILPPFRLLALTLHDSLFQVLKLQNSGPFPRSFRSSMIFMQIVSQKHYIYKSSGTEIAALDQATARTLD